MDFSAFFAGFFLGAPFWVGSVYLLTHPDQRKALFSRVHALFAKTPPPAG